MARISAENAAQCDAKKKYVWICGAVVELAQQTTTCSSPERPLYSGALGQKYFGGSFHTENLFLGLHKLTDFTIQPANVEAYSIGLASALAAGPLPAAPQFDKTKAHPQVAVATYRNIPVTFRKPLTYAINGIKSEPEKIAAFNAMGATVSFKHPDLPIIVEKFMPLDSEIAWQALIDRAIPRVTDAVIAYDPSASCGHPPETLRFQARRYDTRLYTSLLAWKRTQSDEP